MLDRITVHGARQHNLKNIDVEIPRNSFTVVTGLSGSGKSSLAFDTIYAEGQRRYVETLSPYARQFLDQMERPDVDSIDGLSPAISIEQKTTNRSPRSTVGTITEIYDYLRVLYSSIGVPHCPTCDIEISRQSTAQILQQVLALKNGERIMILAPVVRGRKGEYRKEFEKFGRQGFVRARVDGILRSLDEDIPLDKRKNHSIDVVVDRLLVKPGIDQRLEASIETAAKLAAGLVIVAVVNGEERLYSQKFACPNCGSSVPQLEPRSFSFNSPFGACPACNGLGSKWNFDPAKVIVDPSKPLLDGGLGPGATSASIAQLVAEAAPRLRIDLDKPFAALHQTRPGAPARRRSGLPRHPALLVDSYDEGTPSYRDWLMEYMSPSVCAKCHGSRLRPSSLSVKVKGTGIATLTALPILRMSDAVRQWTLNERETQVAGRVVEEIEQRLEFLDAVGLSYLSLDRSAATLSGGEAQRIRLATQIGSKLRGVLYVLDEPSIGLHPARQRPPHRHPLPPARPRQHRPRRRARRRNHLPRRLHRRPRPRRRPPRRRSRRHRHPPRNRAQSRLPHRPIPLRRRLHPHPLPTPPRQRQELIVRGATEHNLKNLTVEFPLGSFIVVTGVSGSGKSTLIDDILYRAVAREVYGSHAEPGAHTRIDGLAHLDKVIEIDQSPIGRTPRSNPATYTGVFTDIRDLYAMLPESRERGYKAGRFSFNVKGGRCEACQGDGLKRIEMNFLPDVYVTCDVCHGRRYNRETLEVKYKGHSIADVLESSVEDALAVLENIPNINAKLKTLVEVGLGYIHLGQSSTTLSGGEAQRIKLARELSRRQTGRTLYILDEPTTGLHFDDVRRLLDVLQRLVDLGNTVLVIEHQLDVIKSADWVIDLGPEGGEKGGHLVAAGPPDLIARTRRSYTGQALAKVLRTGKVA